RRSNSAVRLRVLGGHAFRVYFTNVELAGKRKSWHCTVGVVARRLGASPLNRRVPYRIPGHRVESQSVEGGGESGASRCHAIQTSFQQRWFADGAEGCQAERRLSPRNQTRF